LYFLIIGAVILNKVRSIFHCLASSRLSLSPQLAHYQYSLSLQKYILPPVFLIWSLGELIRYFYATNGNLREKVPDLLTFLLVSLFPQLPLMVYLSFFQEILFPIDILLGCLMLIGLSAQLWFGYGTLRVLIANQTAQFLRLCDNPE
jgi:hypothetical protein